MERLLDLAFALIASWYILDIDNISLLLLGSGVFLAYYLLPTPYKKFLLGLFILFILIFPGYSGLSLFFFPLLFETLGVLWPASFLLFFLLDPMASFLCLVSLLLNLRLHLYQKNKESLISLNDSLREDQRLFQKHMSLLEQEGERKSHLAILGERERISRDLHNSIGHTLTRAILQAETLKVLTQDPALIGPIENLQANLKEGMEETRRTLHALSSKGFQLKEKLSSMDTALKLKVQIPKEDGISLSQKADILSLCKESMTNSIRHGKATEWSLILLEEPEHLSIDIRDNGIGFSLEQKGMGFLFFEELCEKYSGRMHVEEKDAHLYFYWRKDHNENLTH